MLKILFNLLQFFFIINNSISLRNMNIFKTKAKININSLTSDDKYNLNWYVIDKSTNVEENLLYKTTIWDKDYIYWKNNNSFYAMDNDCSHRGASLYDGLLNNNTVICPYHGYEFNNDGNLIKVPGLNFTRTKCQNQDTYNIIEKNGFIYLNTISKLFYNPTNISIYEEPESKNSSFSYIILKKIFKAYGRIVSENSLDVMHIGFVHTFGNKENPSPTKEIPPFPVNDYPFHYKTAYDYVSGSNSIAKKIFLYDNLTIENEFILPHTTIARVIFGNFISTVLTYSTPINLTHTNLFIKTYRNFWNTNNADINNNVIDFLINDFGDKISINLMDTTVEQDRKIIENIKLEYIDGKFNMKFDKLQNLYKSLYKKFIHKI